MPSPSYRRKKSTSAESEAFFSLLERRRAADAPGSIGELQQELMASLYRLTAAQLATRDIIQLLEQAGGLPAAATLILGTYDARHELHLRNMVRVLRKASAETPGLKRLLELLVEYDESVPESAKAPE